LENLQDQWNHYYLIVPTTLFTSLEGAFLRSRQSKAGHDTETVIERIIPSNRVCSSDRGIALLDFPSDSTKQRDHCAFFGVIARQSRH